MSLYRQLVRRFWPRNTRGMAHLQWQAQESRLVEAQQRLAREYQEVRRQAEQAQADTDQGLLRAARLRLDQPLDAGLLQAKDRLQRTFARQGQGFFRRLPSPLEVELAHYLASLEKICRRHGELADRLRLAQVLMLIFDRHPEFSRPNLFRLALISPESAWLLFRLRQKRLRDRRSVQELL
jgi:hypothetical protein